MEVQKQKVEYVKAKRPIIIEIGDIIIENGRGAHVEWEISDFFSLPGEVNDVCRSPVFIFADTFWCLSLYPYGRTDNLSSEFMSLYLIRIDYGEPKTVYLSFSIKGRDELLESETLFTFSSPATVPDGYGVRNIIMRSELRNLKSTLLPNGMLTIICNLRSDDPSCGKGEKSVPKKVCEKSVPKRKEDGDVVLKVQGKEFPAHRDILEARSPVFKAIFTGDAVDVVVIEDCDPETFSDFLVHVYSGSCDHITKENVYSLYTAAFKYIVIKLRRECADFIIRNLTAECFFEAMRLAVRHKDEKLRESVLDFWCDNDSAIMATNKLHSYFGENAYMAHNLLNTFKQNKDEFKW